MATIWKYDIPIEDQFELEVPRSSYFLDVQVQYNKPVMWFVVKEPKDETRTVKFLVVGTGHLLPYEMDTHYLGTFQLLDGNFVGHLFRLDKE